VLVQRRPTVSCAFDGRLVKLGSSGRTYILLLGFPQNLFSDGGTSSAARIGHEVLCTGMEEVCLSVESLSTPWGGSFDLSFLREHEIPCTGLRRFTSRRATKLDLPCTQGRSSPNTIERFADLAILESAHFYNHLHQIIRLRLGRLVPAVAHLRPLVPSLPR
jgi:hypothetical protein